MYVIYHTYMTYIHTYAYIHTYIVALPYTKVHVSPKRIILCRFCFSSVAVNETLIWRSGWWRFLLGWSSTAGWEWVGASSCDVTCCTLYYRYRVVEMLKCHRMRKNTKLCGVFSRMESDPKTISNINYR